MPYGELNIQQEYTGRNRKTGRFMKGNVPANKGKKWDEFLSKRKQKRCAKGWKNLDLYRPKGRPDFGALRQKRVIAINDEGGWAVFSSAVAAEKALRPSHPLIRSKYINYCCREEFIVKAEPAYHEGEYYVYDAIGYYILTREQIILGMTREIPTKLVHSLAIMEEPKDISKWEYRRALNTYLEGKEWIKRSNAAARAASMSLAELGRALEGFGEIVRRASERHH